MATYSGKARSGPGMGFLDTLADIESGNRNIFSGVDADVSGPGTKSQGYFQITTPTWSDFAPKAGVNLSQYPNAMSAPRDVQARVAGYIPFGRFGPRTQRMMGDKYGNLDKRLLVSELASRYGPGTVPAGAGVPTVATASTAGTSSGDAARRQVSPQMQTAMADVQNSEAEKNNAYWRNAIAGMNFNFAPPQGPAPVSGIIEPPPPPPVQTAALGTGGLAQLGGAAPAQAPQADPQAQRQQALAALLQQLNAPVMGA